MDALSGVVTTLPLDFFAIGGVALLIAIDSLRSGIGRAAAIAVALSLSYVFNVFLAKSVLASSISSPMIEAIALGALFVLSYVLVRRIGLEYLDGGMGQPVHAAVAACAVCVIGIVIWLETPALGSLWELNSQIQAIFTDSFRLFWLLGSYAALAFARG